MVACLAHLRWGPFQRSPVVIIEGAKAEHNRQERHCKAGGPVKAHPSRHGHVRKCPCVSSSRIREMWELYNFIIGGHLLACDLLLYIVLISDEGRGAPNHDVVGPRAYCSWELSVGEFPPHLAAYFGAGGVSFTIGATLMLREPGQNFETALQVLERRTSEFPRPGQTRHAAANLTPTQPGSQAGQWLGPRTSGGGSLSLTRSCRTVGGPATVPLPM
jgi:hypothetical protein